MAAETKGVVATRILPRAMVMLVTAEAAAAAALAVAGVVAKMVSCYLYLVEFRVLVIVRLSTVPNAKYCT